MRRTIKRKSITTKIRAELDEPPAGKIMTKREILRFFAAINHYDVNRILAIALAYRIRYSYMHIFAFVTNNVRHSSRTVVILFDKPIS